ncbi:MAG: aminotransferase, partial [Gammaproteobacteria bacterium]|nr:aminotransferase [Gammaproteobacteria bacterium]
IIALRARERILERNHRLIDDNLAKLEHFFADYPALFDWTVPDGGCIAYPRYQGRDGVETFCRELVEQAGVLLLPSSVYASGLTDTPADRFRIGFGRARIGEGLAAIRAFLDTRAGQSVPA